MNVQQQHYGNCAVQTAQLLVRYGELRFGKNNTPGYSEEQMEILANCPKASGYSRLHGTTPVGSLSAYENAGMITCHHPATSENITRAIDAGYPVSTGHKVEDLWGESSGGHRVATVGYLQDKNTGNVTAYLVHDTGRDCLYYVPARRYKKSLNPGDMIVVVGRKTNCKDPDGNPVKPGACCLSRYAKRKQDLEASLSEQATTTPPSDNRGKWVEFYKAQARQARGQIDELKWRYEFGRQMQILAEASGDQRSAEAWAQYSSKAQGEWRTAYDKWKKAKEDLLAKQDNITPMGENDPGADVDRRACSEMAKNMKCEEQRQPCPVCGK